jgi:ATP-dependent Lon protease
MLTHVQNISIEPTIKEKQIKKLLKMFSYLDSLNKFPFKTQALGVIWLNTIWYKMVKSNGFLTIKKTLSNLNIENDFNLFVNEYYKDDLNCIKTNYFIKNFLNLITPFNCQIKKEYNDTYQLNPFLIRPVLPGTYNIVNGIGINIKTKNMNVRIYGIIDPDKFYIYRNNICKNEILNILKERFNIDETDINIFFNCLSLRDYIVNENRQIANIIKNQKEKVDFYKKAEISIILAEYGFLPEYLKIELINLLLEFNLVSKANHLYKKIPFDKEYIKWNNQNLLTEYIMNDPLEDEEKNKDVPYEIRISSLKASNKIKQKAYGKLNTINKSNDSCPKSQKYLDGLLKIPFETYKDESELKDSTKELYNEFCKKYPDFKKEDLNSIEIYDYVKSLCNTTKVSKECKKIIRNIDICREHQQQYINKVEAILEKHVHGHPRVKTQIKRQLAKWAYGGQSGTVIGLEGPPGCGKTTLIKNGLAKCLLDHNGEPRPVGFIPLGGYSNASSLVGHNYTYQGSTWGRICDILIESQCLNPIFMFDELDKISNTASGSEITGVLTHLTDSTQNNEFYDKYFDGIPLDLSKAIIIFTFNDRNLIDPILLDRITIIKTDYLNLEDKLVVSRKHLIPQILSIMDLKPKDIEIDDEIIKKLISDYTREAGARQLKKILDECISELNYRRLLDPSIKLIINEELINTVLKHKDKIKDEEIPKKELIGQINGLYANALGLGGILPIQVSGLAEKSKFELTGKQGEVMKESMACAKTVAFNLIKDTELKEKMKEQGLHVHCPSTSIPKDGPSAGGAISLAIYSYLTQKYIRNDVCMTGEIDLNGNITKIGGLEAKLVGARKAGATLALIPEENKEQLEKLYSEGKLEQVEGFRVIPISNINQATEHIFI